jgi:bacteriocin biosynthesis cyclodehydratase domain-containing protein
MLAMVVHIDPRVPLVWRDPTSMQFGIDRPRVILRDVDATTERMIAALVAGVSRTGLTMIGGQRAAPLLEALAPVLETPLGPKPRVVVVGRTVVADRVAGLLAAASCDVDRRATAAAAEDVDAALGIAIGEFVLDPQLHGLWLRRDVPHLPVVVGDQFVTIGPVVEPGDGPCLHCMHLWRRDSDAAWPAIVAQAWGRIAPIDETAISEAAAAIARVALARVHGDPMPAERRMIRLSTGETSSERVAVHPECECSDALGESERGSSGHDNALVSRGAPQENGSVGALSPHHADAQPTRVSVAIVPE